MRRLRGKARDMTSPSGSEPVVSAESLLAEINVEFVEKVRVGYPWGCRLRRAHLWGYSVESRKSKQPVAEQVCVRGRNTMKGRCGGTRLVTVPDTSLPTDGIPSARIIGLFDAAGRVMGMPRALRLDWGQPLETREAEDG